MEGDLSDFRLWDAAIGFGDTTLVTGVFSEGWSILLLSFRAPEAEQKALIQRMLEQIIFNLSPALSSSLQLSAVLSLSGSATPRLLRPSIGKIARRHTLMETGMTLIWHNSEGLSKLGNINLDHFSLQDFVEEASSFSWTLTQKKFPTVGTFFLEFFLFFRKLFSFSNFKKFIRRGCGRSQSTRTARGRKREDSLQNLHSVGRRLRKKNSQRSEFFFSEVFSFFNFF
jgi:hypothetical protein